MEEICIIKSKNELEGTCYIEVLPGAYQGHCWNEGSLFFNEEVFGFIEPLIERHAPAYSHYAFTVIEKERWFAILSEFDLLRSLLACASTVSELQGHVGFLFKGTEDQFDEKFRANAHALSQLISEFSAWVRVQVDRHGSITVLGI